MLKQLFGLRTSNVKTLATTVVLVVLCVCCLSQTVQAQATAFTYQGKLSDSGTPPTGQYDFTFKLFADPSGVSQIGLDVVAGNVSVTSGAFKVSLDFGSNFPGADRYLKIAVRQHSTDPNTPAYTPLAPLQKITSTPYSIQSLNAATASNSTQLGGVAANQFVQTTDTRLTDSRPPTTGSGSYVQNQNTTSPQTADFNINGNGTASLFNARAEFEIGGNRILSNAGTNNLFAGVGSGLFNTGGGNSFFGHFAGFHSTTGDGNSFFGRDAGLTNTTGGFNLFAGTTAGQANTGGSNNAFVGTGAGQANTMGDSNSFVGTSAGYSNQTGSFNSFLGRDSGVANTTGSNNTIIGAFANVGAGNLANATAIGTGAVVSTSNTVVLGRDFDTVTVPGRLVAGSLVIQNEVLSTATGFPIVLGASSSDRVIVPGKLEVWTLGSGGNNPLCIAGNTISTCSSSLRYKTNIAPFNSGLNLINRLRPIAFTWKEGGMKDMGLGAEDVAKVEPLLVTYNQKGEVEGVKYDRVGVVLVNAVQEQQLQIGTQQKQLNEQQKLIKKQQAEIEALKVLVCSQNVSADICKPKN